MSAAVAATAESPPKKKAFLLFLHLTEIGKLAKNLVPWGLELSVPFLLVLPHLVSVTCLRGLYIF